MCLGAARMPQPPNASVQRSRRRGAVCCTDRQQTRRCLVRNPDADLQQGSRGEVTHLQTGELQRSVGSDEMLHEMSHATPKCASDLCVRLRLKIGGGWVRHDPCADANLAMTRPRQHLRALGRTRQTAHCGASACSSLKPRSGLWRGRLHTSQSTQRSAAASKATPSPHLGFEALK